MNVVECDGEILQKRLVGGLAMRESAASARHYQQGGYRETDRKPHSHCAFLRELPLENRSALIPRFRQPPAG
jgi:hypothetical protein